MKSLLLLRHAKSSWKNASLPDEERPLKGRGRRAAGLIGRFLNKRGLRPDLVLSSAATRARETVELVLEAAQFDVEVTYNDRLYLACVTTLLDTVAKLDNKKQQVLLVGHNPGLEEFVFRLTGAQRRMPTAALAQILIDSERWGDVSRQQACKLDLFVKPKELL